MLKPCRLQGLISIIAIFDQGRAKVSPNYSLTKAHETSQLHLR